MRTVFTCVTAALLLVVIVGCESGDKEGWTAQGERTVYCDKCKKNIPVGTYCAKCQCVAGCKGMVHCDKCGKDVQAGTYCAKCNRFILRGKVHCDKCGKDVPRGTYCPVCDKYVGLDKVAYCKTCRKPYNKCDGCPGCGRK